MNPRRSEAHAITTLAVALLLAAQIGLPGFPLQGRDAIPDDHDPPVNATYAQRDPSGTGWIGLAANTGVDHVVFFPDDRMTPVSLVDLGHIELVHESEPDVVIARHDALGRPARLMSPRCRYTPGEDAVIERGVLVVTGGMTPGAWSRAIGRAYEGPEPAPGDWARALVERGFVARRWETREAAVAILVRMGERAMPALVQVGLHHADWEVRDRSAWALEEIRTGHGVRRQFLGGVKEIE